MTAQRGGPGGATAVAGVRFEGMEQQSVEVGRAQDGPIPCPQCGNPDPSKIIKCPYCRYVPGTKQLRKAPPAAGIHRLTIPGLFLAGAIIELIALALVVAVSDTAGPSPAAAIVVWALLAVGSVVLLVASVAAGVSLGVRASRDG